MSNSIQAPANKPSVVSRLLRVAAALVLAASLGFWAAKGANLGWNKDQVPVKQTDEVTGIEFVTYEKRFVPGVEFLALSTGLAAGLFVVSFFFRTKTTQPS